MAVDMTLVVPVVVVSHQEAAAGEMLGALLLELGLPGEATVFGQKLFDKIYFGEAQLGSTLFQNMKRFPK